MMPWSQFRRQRRGTGDPGLLVGDNPFRLAEAGNVGAVWVKTVPDEAGRIEVIAAHSSLGSKTVEIKVRPESGSAYEI